MESASEENPFSDSISSLRRLAARFNSEVKKGNDPVGISVFLRDLLCGGDAVWRETLRLKVAGLETELTAGSSSLAVKLAARRVALSWLTLQVVDGNCAEQAQCGPVPRRWQDYRDASERRYLTALKFFHSIHTLPNRDNRAHQSSAPRSAASGKGRTPNPLP